MSEVHALHVPSALLVLFLFGLGSVFENKNSYLVRNEVLFGSVKKPGSSRIIIVI